MSEKKNLFREFPPVSRNEWMEKLIRDLKGKSWEELQWQLEENITLSPFYHPDEVEMQAAPLVGSKVENKWEIGEYIEVGEMKTAKQQVLEGLAGGLEAPLFCFKRELAEGELEQLLEGVSVEYISTHFAQLFPGREPWVLVRNFYQLIKERGIIPKKVSGSIDFDPFLDWAAPPLQTLVETIDFCTAQMPSFNCLQINGRRFHSGIKNTSDELAFIIAKGSEYLFQMKERGLSPSLVNGKMQFSLDISSSYFVAIAKIRALKLLWAKVTEAFTAEQALLPFIVVHLSARSHDKEANTNMISATTQAIAAVSGGVDRLYILPADASLNEGGTSFSRRIARNVQHILKMEAQLDRVIDPAAGSYYIEKLTELLAEEAWGKFQKIEAKGGYLRGA